MQEPQASPPVPDTGPKPSEQIRPVGLFSDLKYPAPPVPHPVPTANLTKPTKIFSRVVLPLVIFVVLVAGLAWVTQFLPGRTQINPLDPIEKPKLQFTNGTHYVWPPRPEEQRAVPKSKKLKPGQKQQKMADPERKLPPYYGEFETITNDQQDGGFCDYEFTNPFNQPLEMRLQGAFCTCSKLEVALLTDSQLGNFRANKKKVLVPHGKRYGQGIDDFGWVELKKDQADSSVVVEPKQSGIVRLHWDGRGKEKPGTHLLWATLRVNAKGNPQSFNDQKLNVYVNYVEPVGFEPSKLPVMRFAQGAGDTREFTLKCWSATRDLAVQPDETDPCVAASVKPLSTQECLALEKTLLERDISTRIRSAFQIDVKLYEKKDGKQLNLGVFEKLLPVRFKDKDTGEELKNLGVPELTGTVRGDFKVNGSNENLKIDLGPFGAREAPRKIKLWTKDVALESDAVLEPRVGGISAAVSKAKEGDDHNWLVTLTISDNVVSGPLPQNLVLVLRLRNGTQTIRIPVTGHRSH